MNRRGSQLRVIFEMQLSQQRKGSLLQQELAAEDEVKGRGQTVQQKKRKQGHRTIREKMLISAIKEKVSVNYKIT